MAGQMSKAELDALNAKFEREDQEAEDAPEVPEQDRVVSSHNAFADHGVEPRTLGGIPFSDVE